MKQYRYPKDTEIKSSEENNANLKVKKAKVSKIDYKIKK